jgi:hypothetical protein
MRLPAPSADRRPSWSLAWITAVLLLLLVGFVVLLWVVGVFDFQKKAKAGNAQVYAAVLGLLGGLFATSLTFVGALLKHSVDVRTLGQSRETEERLRLETSIRAVELLTEDGKKASPARQAGALFVLGSLDQLDFALALLGQIWPGKDISPGAAVWVVDRGLMSKDERTQIDAALVLLSNADNLKDTWESSCWEWPQCISYAWTNQIAPAAREVLLDALLKVLASKPKDEWDPSCVNSLLIHFDLIRRIDDKAYIRNGALQCVDLLLDTDRYSDPSLTLFAPHGEVSVAALREEISTLVSEIGDTISGPFAQSITALRTTWVDGDGAVPPLTGPTPGAQGVAPTLGTGGQDG